jgi:Zn-dependent M28 family amino/carboxypeptidase
VLIPADADLGAEVQLKVPPRRRVSEQVRNVAGVLRGSDPRLSAEAIVITAHLDHIGRAAGDRQGDVIFNGADDNATGVTAVVTLAEAFGRLQPRPARSVVFITFWGEEKGLLGSKAWCEQPLWPLEKTVANINIEMIGRPEEGAAEKMWGTGWTRSSLGPQLAAGAKRAGIEVFHREDVSEMLYARSDNYSFVQKGVIAHSFSAGSLHQDYHQLTDEFTRLNIPHMTRIIQGLFAGSLPLARGELTPTKSAAAKPAP